MYYIRSEKEADHQAVHEINRRAFDRDSEADLVNTARAVADPVVSRVAVSEEGGLVGHILFTPVTIEGAEQAPLLMGLGPVAVLPERQGEGIGAQLVKDGLGQCHSLGVKAVFVLGHPEYYSRFGFRSAPKNGFHYRTAEFDPAFMVLELEPNALKGCSGTVRYLPVFDGA